MNVIVNKTMNLLSTSFTETLENLKKVHWGLNTMA